jgi:hypothetical protein
LPWVWNKLVSLPFSLSLSLSSFPLFLSHFFCLL